MIRTPTPTENKILKTLTAVLLPMREQLENEFECMYWAQELEFAADGLKRYANDLFEDNLYGIYESGQTSSMYQIQFPFEVFHTVNYDALATDLPKVYEQLVYVRPDDALRIAGKKKIYNLCMEEDMARTRQCETIALDELRKTLSETEIRPYLITHEKPQKPVIIPLTEVTP